VTGYNVHDCGSIPGMRTIFLFASHGEIGCMVHKVSTVVILWG